MIVDDRNKIILYHVRMPNIAKIGNVRHVSVDTFWVFLLTDVIETFQDRVVCGTCGKDTAATWVSIRI